MVLPAALVISHVCPIGMRVTPLPRSGTLFISMTMPPTQHDSEQVSDEPIARSGSGRVLGWWESLPARRQVLWGWIASALVLGVVHIPFVLSGNITVARAVGYAISESLPAALLVTFATQTELARRRHLSDQSEDSASSTSTHHADTDQTR